MSNKLLATISRRGFVGRFGTMFGAMALGSPAGAAEAGEASPASGGGELPRAVLGRTKLSVTRLTLGTAPCGIARTITPTDVARIVNEAIDLGINSIDTSEKYGNAEEGVGLGLGRRRKDIVLGTKVWADTVDEAESKLAKTFKTLKTDCADLLYFHHLGGRDVKRAREADGVFTWLVKQKQAGKCRFLGVSGHNLPGRFAPFLESGEVDVLLVGLNFVDRHTYNFEERVLPVARKHDTGILAMKVFGGPDPKTGSWGNPQAKPGVGDAYLELAVRYALSLPGVATVNLGVHSVEQLRHNVEIVKRFQPLRPEDETKLAEVGRELAADWGPHFGPVEEEEEERTSS